MLTKFLFVFVGCFLSLTSSSAPFSSNNNSAKTIELGYGYIVGEEAVPHATAKSFCELVGGKELVSIQNQEEDELILSLLGTAGFTSSIWTSGTNPDGTRFYKWGNGTPMFHTRWWPSEPSGDGTYCVALDVDSYDRLWYTTSCTNNRYPLCENKTIY